MKRSAGLISVGTTSTSQPMTTYIEVLRYAQQQAEIWAHLPPEQRADQIDAHLGSEFPDVPDRWKIMALETVTEDDT